MPKLHTTEIFLKPNGDGRLYIQIHDAKTKEPYAHIILDEASIIKVRGMLTKFLATGKCSDA